MTVDYTGIGQMFTGAGLLITAIVSLRTSRKVKEVSEKVVEVHDEVKTSNGKTLARLADLTEGRRIRSDVHEDDRTPADRAYVEEVTRDDEDPTT